MISVDALSGYLLEEALAHLLYHNGYRSLRAAEDDRDVLVSAGHGLLVRGRGANHQADALGELKVPSPFSLPVRLFVEAKNRRSGVGLPDVRNAHGVIADVNEYYSTAAAESFVQPLRRHLYRYALFSAGGFARDAQLYALAQQISLIDLSGPAFEPLIQLIDDAASVLRRDAMRAGLTAFPLGQVRAALRRAFDIQVGNPTSEGPRASEPVVGGLNGFALDYYARSFVTELTKLGFGEGLLLGFPAAPFILVLRADDLQALGRYVGEHGSLISVDIRFSRTTPGLGEWTIRPAADRSAFRLRFGIPGILETWLLAESGQEKERAAQARRDLFHTIDLFLEDQLVQLRFEPAVVPAKAYERAAVLDQDDEFSAALDGRSESFLRNQLRGDPTEEGETETFAARGQHWDPAPRYRSDADFDPASSGWSLEAVSELLMRLDAGAYPQSEMIRIAASNGGTISRDVVYAIAGYEPTRTLRGLTRPTNRITTELIEQGMLPELVVYPFVARYDSGVVATHFWVHPEIAHYVRALNPLWKG